MHVPPAPFGTQASLSAFMTGTTVADPTDPATVRTFNVLNQRAVFMDALISTPCLLFAEVLPPEITVHGSFQDY